MAFAGFQTMGPNCCCCNDIFFHSSTSTVGGDNSSGSTDASILRIIDTSTSRTICDIQNGGSTAIDRLNKLVFCSKKPDVTDPTGIYISHAEAKDYGAAPQTPNTGANRTLIYSETGSFILQAIGLDAVNELVYWVKRDNTSATTEDNRQIYSTPYAGTSASLVADIQVRKTRSVGLLLGSIGPIIHNSADGRLYYCVIQNVDNDPEYYVDVRRIEADGSGEAVLYTVRAFHATENSPGPIGQHNLCLDYTDEKIYWTQRKNTGQNPISTVRRMNWDGSSPEVLYTTSGSDIVRGLAFSHKLQKLFYVQSGATSPGVFQADKDMTNSVPVYTISARGLSLFCGFDDTGPGAIV